jgi:preprotein translocase subunit SecY
MNWKTILKSFNNWDMQKRLIGVIAIIVVYRFLAHIPVPLADPTEMREVLSRVIGSSSFGGFLNLLSGGALAQMSIVLVGLSPFITSSIIIQLLTKAIPSLEEIHNDGESGRRKLNQWTRMITVPLAIVQSVAFIYILRQTILINASIEIPDPTLTQWVVAVAGMSAGSILLMWLGELVTERGIGNGISLLIFAGIISQMPNTLGFIGSSLFNTDEGVLNVFNWFTIPVNPLAFWVVLAVGVASLIVLHLLVKINEAQRIITINYAKRLQGNSSYGGVRSILPVKLITAGVIPVIFAVAFLSIPAFIGQVLLATGNDSYQDIANKLIAWFQTPQPGSFTGTELTTFIYPLAYFVLVVAFTYFYTGIVLNAKEISENMQKQGGFFEGVRPGIQTEKYLRTVVNRLTLFGSLALGVIAILPFVAEYTFAQLGVSASNLAVGGTGLLIVVQVGLETLRQINSRALMITYDDY